MKKISYKAGLIGLGVIFSLLVTTTIYYLRYPIAENNHTLREGAVNFVHTTNDWNNLTLYDSVSFDNKKYLVFGGKNPDFLISEIRLTLDSKDYSIKFYTATGQDITNTIEL